MQVCPRTFAWMDVLSRIIVQTEKREELDQISPKADLALA